MDVVDISSRLIKSHKDLKVYQLAYPLSLEVHKATIDFPKIEQFSLADQMRRAGMSICGNLAEGFARQQESDAEFKRFVQMAYGSAREMDVWLDYAKDLGYISGEQAAKWQDKFDQVSRMLLNLKARK